MEITEGKRKKMLVTSIFSFSQSVFQSLLHVQLFNPLQDNNFLDWTKFKAFADDNLFVAKIMISAFDRIEINIVGKGENAGYQHFLLF